MTSFFHIAVAVLAHELQLTTRHAFLIAYYAGYFGLYAPNIRTAFCRYLGEKKENALQSIKRAQDGCHVVVISLSCFYLLQDEFMFASVCLSVEPDPHGWKAHAAEASKELLATVESLKVMHHCFSVFHCLEKHGVTHFNFKLVYVPGGAQAQ